MGAVHGMEGQGQLAIAGRMASHTFQPPSQAGQLVKMAGTCGHHVGFMLKAGMIRDIRARCHCLCLGDGEGLAQGSAMISPHQSQPFLVTWMSRHAGSHQSSWGQIAKGTPGWTHMSHLDLPGGRGRQGCMSWRTP